MNRRIYALPALLPGLIAAQAIATIQVYLSNTGLYRTLEIIRGHGYLPIPNEQVMPSLHQFLPAFCGALFFTLTLGAGLSLASLLAAWSWDPFFRRNRILLATCSLFWLALVAALNLRGLNLLTSAYFLLIPPLVFRVALGVLPQVDRRRAWRGLLTAVLPVLALAALWLPHMDRNFFGEFRDRLLLSNRFGRSINRFYYDYTLYAAEVFKSLDQKTIKTCRLDGLQPSPMASTLAKELGRYGYLAVSGPAAVDLQIVAAGERIILVNDGLPVIQTILNDLTGRTGPLLKEYSLKSDRQIFFRKVVFFSLLFGLPVLLYVLLLDLFRFAVGFLLEAKTALLAGALVCFCLGAGLLAVFSSNGAEIGNEVQAAQALRSENLPERTAALKFIARNGLEIATFADYDRLRSSPHISERCWLARTLGASRRRETFLDLLSLLDDPHLNVACAAHYALGQRGDRRAVPEILKRMATSRHWYGQWYAYEALKSLGWTPIK